ncbi:thiol-disulfide isomerase/thioredoxin [Pedobacter africanus]|uniref:Thiol-disulfide isomerase/thioredoxin n=1 Tax=Pedobacter africanus TaxID=151894 RepID=A0ACC6L3U8_9SPHI|nr:TlpA disulfide reductase family protein [Pedobacter africanus]MDR6786328.1 thiol-disulfide isomerase/thioredoxin [Pedobacter africanus]
MRKTVIIIFLALATGSCFGQSIDTAALGILQRSYKKLAAMQVLSYELTKVDTMIRDGMPPQVEVKTVFGNIKKNAYWQLRFDDNTEWWLIRGDTLYKKETSGRSPIVSSGSWDKHSMAANSIYHILGRNCPGIEPGITAIQFATDTSKGDLYLIDVIRQIDYQTDEIKSERFFNRYWVDKKSLFCKRRMMYSRRLESGQEAIDIYDFSVSLKKNPADLDFKYFFNGPVVKETVVKKHENLTVGTIAPDFTITDVKTDKPLKLDDLRGKVVLLDFWYMACMPCRILIPRIQKLQEKFKNENVAIIGINISDSSAEKILSFLNDRKISYPQYYQTGKLVQDYKLNAFPTTLVLDKEGRVKLLETGVAETTESVLEQAIRKELGL